MPELAQVLERISIHAPRTGSDGGDDRALRTAPLFQSTLPARGATIHPMQLDAPRHISIHAPRTGSDENGAHVGDPSSLFQSTLPARGATVISYTPSVPAIISIHAPRTGSDIATLPHAYKHPNFNPRSPHGERPVFTLTRLRLWLFQSTLPARGATGLVRRPEAVR